MKAALQGQLEQRIRELTTLPALPQVLLPLMRLLELPANDVDVARVVELVSYDHSIAAQCIRMANSAMFGRSRPVESVRGAVVSLGLWRTSDIVFSCVVPDIFSSMDGAVDGAVFWRHSLCCALVSQRLAQLIRSHSAEKAYLAGLLHDMGVLLNSVLFPREFREALETAAATHSPLVEAERKVLGFTHSESGRILADQWHFSADITVAVEYHHDVAAAPSVRDLVAIVHLSDLICRHQGSGYGYLESLWSDFCYSPAWLVLLQTCKWMPFPDISSLAEELRSYCEEVVPLVDGYLGPLVGSARCVSGAIPIRSSDSRRELMAEPRKP